MIWKALFGDDKRAHKARGSERIGTSEHDLSTHLGRVMDISASGMRLRADKRPSVEPGECIDLKISNGSQGIRVRAVVAWVRRRAGAHEVGLRFMDASDGAVAGLMQMARHGFVNTTSGGSVAPVVSAKLDVLDLYAVLGIERGASEEEIRRAYHQRAREAHPDSGHEGASEESFALISKSYSVLRDPAMRAKYDRMLANAA